MISLNNVGSAGQALHYFSKDNYYTKNEGLEHSAWFGKGAARLGLTGKIEQKAFFNLLSGKIEGQVLGKWVRNKVTGEKEREHRPGIDITFSAPKSVSILAEISGQQDVREAHEAAVKEALTYIEKNLIATRITQNRETKAVKTGNMMVSLFRHNTSRDLDPQTHTHAVIMNATLCEDGQWRSLMNDDIYRAQGVIGAIYTSALADKLQELGYVLERTDARGNFEIVGVNHEQLAHFSQRRAQITTALEAKGISIQEASAQQKEDATLKTRSHKKSVDHDVLMEEWQTRAQNMGIDFQTIQDRAQSNQKEQVSTRDNPLTGLQAMQFAVEHLGEREAVLSPLDLMEMAIQHSVGRAPPHEVEQAFAHLEDIGELIALSDDQYTTKRMFHSEKHTLDQILAQQDQVAQIMTPEAVAKRIVLAEQQQRITFTPGQKEAIRQTLATEDRYVAIQGLAGTGKTTMLNALREIATGQGHTVRGMAPTGAASKVLALSTKIHADTVSMFLIREKKLQKDIEFVKQYAPDFVRKSELWVVDESSTSPQYQIENIIKAASKADARVVFVGDKLQLQAVEAGKPFEIAQKNAIKTAYMTEINRQKSKTLKRAVDIVVGRDQLQRGQHLTQIELNRNARAFAYMDKAGMVYEVKSDLIKAVADCYLNLEPAKRERTIVFTAFNKDRVEINEGIREGLKELGALASHEKKCEILVSKGWTRAKLKEAQYYTKGDVVRFGRDYISMGVKKGEYARVHSVAKKTGRIVLQKADNKALIWTPNERNKLEVYNAETRSLAVGDLIRFTRNGEVFKNGEVACVKSIADQKASLELCRDAAPSLYEVDLSKSLHWDHAYAVTVHSAQGSTQERAIFHIDIKQDEGRSEKAELAQMAKIFGARSFYVGVTRASHALRIYTNDKEKAAKAICARLDKTSVIETIQNHEKERPSIRKQQGLTKL